MTDFTTKQHLKYLLLIAITTVCVLALSLAYSSHELKKEKKRLVKSDLTVQEANDFLNKNKENKDIILIDLRTPAEYAEGHIAGSVFLNYYNGKTKKLLGKLDTGKDYVLIDAQGRTTHKFMKKMSKQGFKEAHRINGGIKEWREQNLPLETTK